MEIRDARPEDAMGACLVMRRSISELCTADHANDPALLARWLANKTPENFVRWTRRLDSSVLVAVEGTAVLAVGGVTDAGEITLNYVSPDVRLRGVSRAMLAALEVRAAARGNARCILTSTATARRFYAAAGYEADGAPECKFGIPGYPLAKTLRVSSHTTQAGSMPPEITLSDKPEPRKPPELLATG
jgi:GNAT superfamily N-acetyltransferase